MNPLAKCPVCGAAVFFFQSEFGGRVYFDELGPPWPKHPCTSVTEPISGAKRAPSAGRRVSAPWFHKGWRPFIIAEATFVQDRIIQICLVMGIQKKLSVYTSSEIAQAGLSLKEIVAHIRPVNSGRYEISYIDAAGQPKKLRAFRKKSRMVKAVNSKLLYEMKAASTKPARKVRKRRKLWAQKSAIVANKSVSVSR